MRRLCCEDGSEFLFLANSDTEMEEWVNKIQFHAQLPRSLQLMSYDESQKQELPKSTEPPKSPAADRESTSSSRESTPEVLRRKSNNSTGYRNSVKATGAAGDNCKPPPVTAMRGAPPPIPARMPSTEITSIKHNNNGKDRKCTAKSASAVKVVFLSDEIV